MAPLRNRGYLLRTSTGYIGELNIENVIIEINGTFWEKKKNGCDLWIQRSKEKHFDEGTKSFIDYIPKPFMECYANRKTKDGKICYKGEFVFVCFIYKMIALWEEKDQKKMGIIIERSENQNILKKLNEINLEQNK